jgi:GH15 family glucan-1,4-alpha-glucosidase
MRLLDWLLELFEECGEGEFLRPVYTVSGRDLLGEAEVSEALGYRGSRPVRVGNLAAQQLQLDTLGPIAQLLGELARQGGALSPEHYALAERMVALVESRWQDPDHGIWEVRTEQRHFVHSKLMCWQTVVEALEVARYLGIERPEWLTLRDSLRADIEQHGFDEELGSYTAAYGYGYADAALLWVVLSGFHPADHPRAKSTVAYVTEQLLRDGAVYRYLFDDALSGHEGSFYICTGWLIEVLVMMGRADEAQVLFDQLCSRVGPLGLMAEQWDVDLSLALGNFPQAYSHLAMINAAWALSRRR